MQTVDKPNLPARTRLHHEHHQGSSAFIADMVIGLSDGLTVPFALAAGLSGAVSTNTVVVTAGIAEIVAGSIAMGLGGYLSGQTEVDHYRSELQREYDEVERYPERERAEIQAIFADFGFSERLQLEAVEELAKDKEKWVDFMMKNELNLEEPDPKRATYSALTIGLSYIAGGIIPLSPYFFTAHPTDGLLYSTILTLICLFIFGYVKSRVTGQPPVSGAFKVMFIGAIAASAAFGIARLVQGH